MSKKSEKKEIKDIYAPLKWEYDYQFSLLSDSELGALMRSMYDYHFRGKETQFDDRLMKGLWGLMKQDMGRRDENIRHRSEIYRENSMKRFKDKTQPAEDEESETDDDDPNVSDIEDKLNMLDFSIAEDGFRESLIEWIRHKISLGFKPTKRLVEKEYRELMDSSDCDLELFKDIVNTSIANNYRVISNLNNIRDHIKSSDDETNCYGDWKR